jgi:hypothetical protein
MRFPSWTEIFHLNQPFSSYFTSELLMTHGINHEHDVNIQNTTTQRVKRFAAVDCIDGNTITNSQREHFTIQWWFE